MIAAKISPSQREQLQERLLARGLIDEDYQTLWHLLEYGVAAKEQPQDQQGRTTQPPKEKAKKHKGHGRLSEQDYPGARDVEVPYGKHKPGDRCPCGRGHLYGNKTRRLLTLMGNAPVEAIRYLVNQLRCSACGDTFDATPPEHRWGKHHPSACASVALMKYGLGVPGYRLQHMQQYCGVPPPDATQWDMVSKVADSLEPVFKALEHLAAQRDLLHVDDTSMPVLSLIKENKTKPKGARYGSHATGIVSRHGQYDIYLYYVGRNHAGENLQHLLEKRQADLGAPMQMGDASACNTKHTHDTDVAFCHAHAFRKYEELSGTPEVDSILSLMGKVFANDRKTREMDDQKRLRFHQKHSQPVMHKLKCHLNKLLDEKLVEPNSSLGGAIKYMLKRMAGFERFLHVPGAPLDNNLTERALKKIIRLRKNAGFFKTESSAVVGAQVTSVLATTTACGANPMDYFQAVLIHESDVSRHPHRWLPWNYRDRVKELAGT